MIKYFSEFQEISCSIFILTVKIVVILSEITKYNYVTSLEHQKNCKTSYFQSKTMNTTINLVNPEWELVDPTPNIHDLFRKFDLRFFHGKLVSVELEWSKKMYSCAGICYSRQNRLGKSCTIRLSEPLLKLRSRKELVETLLVKNKYIICKLTFSNSFGKHEMIHAFSFVLGIREGNGGHGPNFCKMMESINKSAGTNITVIISYIYGNGWSQL